MWGYVQIIMFLLSISDFWHISQQIYYNRFIMLWKIFQYKNFWKIATFEKLGKIPNQPLLFYMLFKTVLWSDIPFNINHNSNPFHITYRIAQYKTFFNYERSDRTKSGFSSTFFADFHSLNSLKIHQNTKNVIVAHSNIINVMIVIYIFLSN